MCYRGESDPHMGKAMIRLNDDLQGFVCFLSAPIIVYYLSLTSLNSSPSNPLPKPGKTFPTWENNTRKPQESPRAPNPISLGPSSPESCHLLPFQDSPGVGTKPPMGMGSKLGKAKVSYTLS